MFAVSHTSLPTPSSNIHTVAARQKSRSFMPRAAGAVHCVPSRRFILVLRLQRPITGHSPASCAAWSARTSTHSALQSRADPTQSDVSVVYTKGHPASLLRNQAIHKTSVPIPSSLCRQRAAFQGLLDNLFLLCWLLHRWPLCRWPTLLLCWPLCSRPLCR